MKIHNYVVINLEGAKDLLDALGGIDVEVPEDMYYVDKSQDLHINFKAALQHLDGEQILKFIRYRRYPERNIGYVKETLTTDISISSLPCVGIKMYSKR